MGQIILILSSISSSFCLEILVVPVADFVDFGSVVVVGSVDADFVVVAAVSVVGDVAGSVVVADFVDVVGFDFVVAVGMVDWLKNGNITSLQDIH